MAPATGAATMNVVNGFVDTLAFYDSAVVSTGVVSVYSGLDGSGHLLASLTLPRIEAGCGIVVARCWASTSLDFTGIAQSAVFSIGGSRITFDDVTINLYTPAATVPEPAAFGSSGLGVLLVDLFTWLRRRFC